MYSVQIQVSRQISLTLKRCNLYSSLRFSTGVDKLEINTDKPETNNPILQSYQNSFLTAKLLINHSQRLMKIYFKT